ncbi:Gfo/Idh/MocA family protein [Leucothrix pacifica]|uniref:Gfo/Idh/MocA family oxidoreductase n=1 Tax=Leucothrix pacifica TaxID=1247513 RepID=A0A317CBT6_9GAMM|nr:Gfo/Idh/MocA family oxidoreductase [Leucothrix pacifica]PWQ96018.1 gfo/Idh/MocA family oxidoreductase [Leucothrix pacifica]
MMRIVVMGAGLIGSRHVKTIRANPRCELVGVIDPNSECHTDPDVTYFTDIEQVTEPVDGVIIATPTGLHAQNGMEAAQRGWHLLIEKPVTSLAEEADQLIKVVEQSDVKCLVGHHRRYHPSVTKLKQLVNDGTLGMPVNSTLIWAMRKPDSYFEGNWRQSDGSPVMINLIHDIDLMRYVLGDIVEVTGFGSTHVRQTQRIESGAAIIRFASGVCGTISFADTAASPWGFEAGTGENPNIATTQQDMWWITGTKGGLAFPSLTLWQGAEDWSQAPFQEQVEVMSLSPLDAQLDHFIDVIQGKAQPLISIKDAQESLRITRELEDLLFSRI